MALRSGWLDSLQPASFRGVEFKLTNSSVKLGRRTAMHEYPQAAEDASVWVEDLGAGTSIYTLTGFVAVHDDFSARDSLVAAIKTTGEGPLIHPSLGTINAVCVDFTMTEDVESGGLVVFSATFVRTSKPAALAAGTIAPSTTDNLAGAAKSLREGNLNDFASRAKSVFQAVRDKVRSVTQTVTKYVGAVRRVANSALGMVRSVAGMAGVNLGRYNLGAKLNRLMNPFGAVSTATGALSRTNNAVRSVGGFSTSVTNLGKLL